MSSTKAIVYLLLGSNQEGPSKQLAKAQKLISRSIGALIKSSCIYETAAWGNTQQPNFLNRIIKIESTRTPTEVLKSILEIEAEMGRIRTIKNAPRIIDIDILFYDKVVLDTAPLIIPHPLIQERRFVLVPMNELSPNFKHPILQKSMNTLLKLCTDKLDVKKF